jgi:ParB-like chromosome segregation protein Spo0J
MTSRSHAHQIGVAKTVPFSQIFIDPKVNSRKKLKGIPELAKNIDVNGLQSALTVTNGGDDKAPYTLCAGFRRAAALNVLGWGNKPVNIIVVETAPDANLIENVQRADLPALDLAERICAMIDGSYYVPEGTEPKKYTKAEIAGILSKSASHIQNYVRVHNDVTDEVKALVKDHEPSARMLFAWAAMSPAKQLEAATAWVKDQDQLAKSGKTRKAKSKDGGAGSSSPGKEGRERQGQGRRDRAGRRRGARLRPRRRGSQALPDRDLLGRGRQGVQGGHEERRGGRGRGGRRGGVSFRR